MISTDEQVFIPHHIAFRKIPRLSRECVVTEKIDGTNVVIHVAGDRMCVGSKNRWLEEGDDHYGFRQWCERHKDELLSLGDGWHYGEWWGGGIQRGYGLDKTDKRLSLFNVARWCLHGQEPKARNDLGTMQDVLPPCVGLVPVLAECQFFTDTIDEVLQALAAHGSVAAPGYMKPEGVVVYHKAAEALFKKTLEGDGEPKGRRQA